MHSHYIFGILMISYVFAMLFNFIISYKIFKEEKLINGFLIFYLNQATLTLNISIYYLEKKKSQIFFI